MDAKHLAFTIHPQNLFFLSCKQDVYTFRPQYIVPTKL